MKRRCDFYYAEQCDVVGKDIFVFIPLYREKRTKVDSISSLIFFKNVITYDDKFFRSYFLERVKKTR